ncbi:MAG: hypothetical protein QXU98_05500 [Candidatus Parvarchaeota archaeon]
MTQYNLNFQDSYQIAEIFSIDKSVIDLLVEVLNTVGISTIYIKDFKTVDVQRWGQVAVLEMKSANPIIIGKNTYNRYLFNLHYRNIDRELGFLTQDRAIKNEIMFQIIGSNITNGGTVVGMDIRTDYVPMTTVRGISWVNYLIEVWVSY